MVQGVNPFLFCICICVAVCVLVFVQLYPSWAEQSVFGEVSCALLIHSSCGAAEPDSLLLGRAPPLLCAEHSCNGCLPMATNSSNLRYNWVFKNASFWHRWLDLSTTGTAYIYCTCNGLLWVTLLCLGVGAISYCGKLPC